MIDANDYIWKVRLSITISSSAIKIFISELNVGEGHWATFANSLTNSEQFGWKKRRLRTFGRKSLKIANYGLFIDCTSGAIHRYLPPKASDFTLDQPVQYHKPSLSLELDVIVNNSSQYQFDFFAVSLWNCLRRNFNEL